MREILFRGKTEEGEWIEGHYYTGHRFRQGSTSDVYLIRNDCLEDFEVIPETLGEYTGLKDKNGEKIFEGDIVICDNLPTSNPQLIEWCDDGVCLAMVDKLNFDSLYYYTIEDCDKMEIVGNIHDNPEFMKEGSIG